MRLIIAEGTLLTRSGTQWYLTHTPTGRLFEINEPAVVVFEAARDSGSIEAAAKALWARYPEVPYEEVARDAALLVDELVSLGVIA